MSEESQRAHPAVDLAMETAVRGIGLLPRRFVMRAGGTLAAVLCRLLPRKRYGAIRNARRCGIPDERLFYHRAARALGTTVFEMVWLLAHPERPVLEGVTVEGLECLREAAKEGRGVLLASGHFATWDFVGPAAARAGIPVAGTARAWRSARLERRLIALRERAGVKTLFRGEQGTGVAAYRWLKQGNVYCCMMDRISSGRRIMIPFIGEGLNVPTGPAEMARRCGAAVVVGFATRLPGGGSRVRFHRLDDSACDSPASLAAQVGREVEHHLLSWPEQWFWIFRRHPMWKNRGGKHGGSGPAPASEQESGTAVTRS